ncbi:MAG: class I SAM-dependent methyltransferase [Pseudolysinimonas sp.]|uniref:class I SAM-dependent methyltransferase n=1 Tax=Pseudolysinimonas sp. TaxID=2680009 RepID=UPI003C76F2A0
MNDKDQTAKSFSEKWHNNRRLAFDETLDEASDIQRWILTRNGIDDLAALTTWLGGRRRILDAGCGNGRVTALLRRYAPEDAEVVGIDLTASDVAAENLAGERNIRFEKRDLLGDLSGLGEFDLIYCQEVLHHTGDAAGAFRNVASLLSDEGEIAVYVYKVKPPVREYTDDLVRSRISQLPYPDAMDAMRAVTELGRALSDLDVKIEVPDVKVLGISAGTYDIQRFIYHFFAKAFWNPAMDVEANAAINYDWYHPQLATRHTLEEVEGWFAAEGLRVVHSLVDDYGITVRGVRPRGSTRGSTS